MHGSQDEIDLSANGRLLAGQLVLKFLHRHPLPA